MIHGKKNILILGAGVTQIPLIDMAKKMGYHVIVASIPGDYPGFSHADEVCYIDTTDEDGIFKLAVKKKIVGLCTTGTDVAVRSIGYVNSKLGLSGITYEASQLVTDKAKMKAALVSGGVRTAEFRRVFTVEEARIAANEIGYPVMFKCTDQAASKGITKVNSAVEAEKAYAYAIERSKNPYIVVEKYIEGYEIGLDGYVSDESEEFIPHDKLTKSNGVTDIPIGHSLPYLCPDELYKDILEQAKLSCKALSLNYCFINMDLMISNGKCYVIEIGGRTGATCIPDLLSLYCGYNYYEKIIENAVGKTPNMVYEPQCACVAELLLSSKAGILLNANADACNEMKGVSCVLDKKIGDPINAFHVGTDRFGHLITWGSSLTKAKDLILDAKNTLDIQVSTDIVIIERLGSDSFREIVSYLQEIDGIFPVRISSRVDIIEHTTKVLNRGVVIAAIIKGKIVGICLGYANDIKCGRGYLGTLGVSKGYRSLGIGKQLTDEMIRFAREKGMRFVGVHAHRNNKRAIAFYMKNGFELTEDNEKPYDESVYLTIVL